MLRSVLKKSDLANALLAAAKHGHEHIVHLLVEAGGQHMHMQKGARGLEGGEGASEGEGGCLVLLRQPMAHTGFVFLLYSSVSDAACVRLLVGRVVCSYQLAWLFTLSEMYLIPMHGLL